MSEQELQRLYDLLERMSISNETIAEEGDVAALRHAIFIIETHNHVY